MGHGTGQGRGPGRMEGPKAAGPGGTCACPSCGHRLALQAGKPYSKIACPLFGAEMARE